MGCNCRSPCVKKKSNKPPSNYNHLGSGDSVKSIQKLFHRLSGIPLDNIGVHELFWTRAVHPDPCNPYSQVLVPNENEILTIFCTKQNCRRDPLRVIGIWKRDILNPVFLEDCFQKLFHSIVPSVEFVTRGKTDEAKLGCQCNPVTKKKIEEAKKNNIKRKNITNKFTGTKTFGCTKHKFANVCKFSSIPKTENCRKKFNNKSLPHGTDSNHPVLADLLPRLADIAGNCLKELAPDSFYNMFKHAQNAKDCQLGPETQIFGGVTLVSDYVAHPHKDASDFPLGVIALFSFRNFSIPQSQLHILVNYSLKLGGHPGVGFDLGNNSLFFEAAMHETHSSSSFERHPGQTPGRVGLVFNRHNVLQHPDHGSQVPKPPKKTKTVEKKRAKSVGAKTETCVAIPISKTKASTE